MSYLETIRYLGSFTDYEKIPTYLYKESLKLERLKNFLDSIGNPQNSLSCIHVAGTKGKGSTAAFITYILREAGFKVGLYTSPHLVDFRERIRILSPQLIAYRLQKENEFEGAISRVKLSELVNRLKPAIGKYNQSSEYGPLSFFEVYTALAFLYFKEKKTDFVVLETGLGGRLDATNVVNPLVCAITPISYEHTQKLGNTLRKIAREKAGIIKKSPKSVAYSLQLAVVSAPQVKEAAEVIWKKCREEGLKLYEIGKDIDYKKTKSGFKVKGMLREYKDLKVKLLGEHQLINATLAVAAVEGLSSYGVKVGVDSIRKGLYNTIWPGRCEIIAKNPYIVLDGAQNIASAAVLRKAVKENFIYKKLILILGVSSDKDIQGICNELYGLADKVILTKADTSRATTPEILAKYFQGKEIQIRKNIKEAKNLALRIAKKEDLILVTGSLFVVGEFRNAKK